MAVVKIARSRLAPNFQVARAMLSAASAVVESAPKEAINYIDRADIELRKMKQEIRKRT